MAYIYIHIIYRYIICCFSTAAYKPIYSTSPCCRSPLPNATCLVTLVVLCKKECISLHPFYVVLVNHGGGPDITGALLFSVVWLSVEARPSIECLGKH